jgi:DUF4097 and DUF4098 domain-containing protein YvlB
MRFPLILPLALAAVAPPALLAQEGPYVRRGSVELQGHAWVEELECGAPVRPGGRLVLRADQGSVKVGTGRDDFMDCRVRLRAYTKYTKQEEEARRLLRSFDLSLRPLSQGALSLRGRVPRSPLHLKVEYDIRLPRRFHLDLETRAGDLEVEELQGELKAVTAGGRIRAGDVTGPVRAETAGGGIVLGTIGQGAEVRTAGGTIRVGNVHGNAILETSGGEIIAGRIVGSGRVVTAGGDIVLRGAGGDLVVQTAGGQIRIGEAGGGVRAETAGGSIVVDAVRGPVQVQTAGGCIYLDRVDSAVQAATAAGSIRAQITAKSDSFGASLLQTSFGDVEVYLPPDLALTIDAAIQNATGHKILSDFPLEISNGGPSFRPRTVEGHGALNGGGVVLRLRTTAGNIQIRKLDARQVEKLEKKKQRLWQRLLNHDHEHQEK